ncbi:MAG: hypothetical protein JXR31_09990 [Prolixibacteraceae bacterium]|nr:hypothetical protein [Prolixibacteraceae bacterium]MBN2774567.1 hypothetical protein [Prolixibacteraceae bacterium]
MNNNDNSKKHGLGKTAKDRKNNIIVIILAVLLVAVATLFVLQNLDHRQIVTEINKEKDQIQSELNAMIVRYDSLSTENDTLNQELFVAQTKVKDLLLEVEQTKKISFTRISDYQKEITTLRGVLQDFVAQVDSLNLRNIQLMAENREVKEQVAQVEAKNEQLEQETERLQKNLDRAAQLNAVGLIAEPINNRSKPTRFAKRVEKIRITLTISANVTAKRGAKNIYVRIRRPDHLLLMKSENDLFRFEDLRINYSAAREVNYEGSELPVNIFWDNTGEAELMPGKYTVDVFIDGNNIGETEFELQ